MKTLLNILLFVAVVAAAPVNWTGLKDSTNITGAAGTAIVYSEAFEHTLAENKLCIFVFDDTVHANRANDSAGGELGYQLGCPIKDVSGTVDTAWTVQIPVDTFDFQAGGAYDPAVYNSTMLWPFDSTTESNNRIRGQIDTTIGTSSSCVMFPYISFWSPLVRFYFKGGAGNCGTALQAYFQLVQRKWGNVRNQ